MDVVYIDLEKAFDRVNHGVLLDKLIYMKCPDYIIKYVRTFLLKRTQRVCIRNTLSEYLPVGSGVTQGCVI